MKLLWNLLKVAIALALVIPVSILVLATVLGVLGGLIGLAFLGLKLAAVGLIAWGLFSLAAGLMRGCARRPKPHEIKALPAADPYYDAAIKELDRDLGHVARS